MTVPGICSSGCAYCLQGTPTSASSCLLQVENPIPFADPHTARLTTGFLHTKYFHLLLFPLRLSADWSFACVPYVHSLQDARNAATAALYAALLWITIASKPWLLIPHILHGTQPAAAVSNLPEAEPKQTRPSTGGQSQEDSVSISHAPLKAARLSADAQTQHARKQQQATWQMVIVVGLMVGPFVPAANIFFYVGTFIGERLLYLPSVGYCMLLSHYLVKLMGHQGLQRLHSIALCLGLSDDHLAMPGSMEASSAAAETCSSIANPGDSRQPGAWEPDPPSQMQGIQHLRQQQQQQLSKQQREQQEQQQQQLPKQERQQDHQQQQESRSNVQASTSSEGSKRSVAMCVRGWVGVALVGMLLGGYSWRTVTRNRDWQDEETLFIAAQQVS